MSEFKVLEQKFVCGTCKKVINRFLVNGEIVDSEYMKDIVFQVMNSDNTPICFGVTPATKEKFKIFNYLK